MESLEEGTGQSIAMTSDRLRLDHYSQYQSSTGPRNPSRRRLILLSVLFALGIIGAIVTYWITMHEHTVVETNGAQDSDHTQALSDAKLLLDTFLDRYFGQQLELFSLSHSITTAAQASLSAATAIPDKTIQNPFDPSYRDTQTPTSWPRVTVNDFDLHVYPSLPAVGIRKAAFAPLLRNDMQRMSWEAYANQQKIGRDLPDLRDGRTIEDGIYRFEDNTTTTSVNEEKEDKVYSPVWQVYPDPLHREMVMWNQMSDPLLSVALRRMQQELRPVRSKIGDGMSVKWVTPIFDETNSYGMPTGLVGSVTVETDYLYLFQNVLGESSPTMNVWIQDSCTEADESHQLQVKGNDIVYMGFGTRRNTVDPWLLTTSPDPAEMEVRWEEFLQHAPSQIKTFFALYTEGSQTNESLSVQRASSARAVPTNTTSHQACGIQIQILPVLEPSPTEHYGQPRIAITDRPAFYAFLVAMLVLLSCAVGFLYDCLRPKARDADDDTDRDRRSSELLNSFFPSVVRDRVVRSNAITGKARAKKRSTRSNGGENSLKSWTTDQNRDYSPDRSVFGEPIAEMFSHTTVVFADIAGFTAWSSQREPAQVFQLLETLYREFDIAAKRIGVFKVETIGDCYVAAAGLPEANKDHAIIMARFASECVTKMNQVVRELEVTLGPGTSDLGLRVGLHSGPVTAGVLRGEKARFQLFGDTVNTASRMESNGLKNRIHVSEATADLIAVAGKRHWLTPRLEKIKAKGKGEMQTYWLQLTKKNARELLTKLQTVQSAGKRIAFIGDLSPPSSPSSGTNNLEMFENEPIPPNGSDMTPNNVENMSSARDERLIEWTTRLLFGLLNGSASQSSIPTGSRHSVDEKPPWLPVTIGGALARQQLNKFLKRISAMYPESSFYNIEHATVVAMFAHKLTKQASVQVQVLDWGGRFQLLTEPMVHFAIVLAALLREIGRRGEGNPVLAQTTLQTVWEILNEGQYKALFGAICSTDSHIELFHHILAEAVLTIDLSNSKRRGRGIERASNALPDPFVDKEALTVDPEVMALIKIIIQASDIAHALQHWTSFSEWNERLYDQKNEAFVTGTSESNPALDWYEQIIKFFQNVAIPVAETLQDRTLGGEHLLCALENFQEWQVTGKAASTKLLVERQRTPSKNSLAADSS